MNPTDKSAAEREAFEATVGRGRDLHRDAGGDYMSVYVQNDWDVWQVAAKELQRAASLTTPSKEPAGAVADLDVERLGTPTLESELRFMHEHNPLEGYKGSTLWHRVESALASLPSSAPAESGWQWVSIIRESVRRAEASHSAMSYGDEKSGAVSDYTRGWGDCLVIFKQAASRLPAESAWQWVPKELTPAMIEAAMQVKRERLKEALQQIRAGKDETEARTPVIKGEWDAMLAVAPQAVQAGGEGGNG